MLLAGLCCSEPVHLVAGILGGESAAALAGGINIMLWHDVTAGICALQVRAAALQSKWFASAGDKMEHEPM